MILQTYGRMTVILHDTVSVAFYNYVQTPVYQAQVKVIGVLILGKKSEESRDLQTTQV